MEKYTIIDKKTLADTLNFMGFRYMVFDKEDRKIYTFEDTAKFRKALGEILQLRKEIQKY